MRAAFRYVGLSDEDLEALGELVETVMQQADREPPEDDQDESGADHVAAVVLARLQRTEFGRLPEPTLAVASIPRIETQGPLARVKRPGQTRSFEVALPPLESLGYKPAARLELTVHPGRRTADLAVILFPACERPERLRATVTAWDGSQHTVVIADDATGMIEDIPSRTDDRGPLVVTWHYR